MAMPLPLKMFSLEDGQKEYDSGVRGPAAYPLTDDDVESKYTTYVRTIWDEQREAMEPLFLTWTQNLLYLAGYQWWSYDTATGTFKPPKQSKWRERPVRNLMKPFFKHWLAKAIKNRPVPICIPASTDPEDLQASSLGKDVLEGKWQELNFSNVLRRAIAWIVPTGNAWVGPYWNEMSGKVEPVTTMVEAVAHDRETGEPAGVELIEVPVGEDGQPLMDESGNYDLEAEPLYIDIGDVGYKVYSPYQVFTDPGATCEEEMTFVVIVESLTLREIHRRYPETIEKGLTGEDTSELDRFDEMMSAVVSGADTHTVGVQQSDISQEIPKAYVFHYFERPSADYGEGRHWVSCMDYLLEMPGPLPDGIWPPVVHLWDIDSPGSLHGEATMTAAIGLQREYNEICGQIKEHHNLLLRGKWLVPIGSNIRRGQITTQPGEVIQHTPGLAPQMAELKPLPAKVYEEREKVLADFELITSMRQISMGQPPPGVTSGRAFLILQEADDSDLGPFIQMLENAVARIGWLTIQLVQRFYDDERLVRIAGSNHRFKVRKFRGADLSSIVDVVPQAGSAFPWSAVAKQSMMIDLAQTIPTLFMDPESGMFDTERFRRLLPIGGEEAVGIESDLDVAEAQREEEAFELYANEIDEMGNMVVPQVQPWQNHMIHLRQHARLLKGTQFLQWAPENQALMIQHYVETQQTLMALQAAQMDEEDDDLSPGGGNDPEAGEDDKPPVRQSKNEEAPSE